MSVAVISAAGWSEAMWVGQSAGPVPRSRIRVVVGGMWERVGEEERRVR